MAKVLYHTCKALPIKGSARDQLLRASLSVCLNLAEGSVKQTDKERRRFYFIALGSQRETHCVLDLEGYNEALELSDQLGASLYCLIQSIRA